MNKTLVGISTVFLVVIIVATVYFAPFISNLQNTTISISSINVEPQGAPVGNEWHGSYWNILVYINANDDLKGVILPEGQTGSVTYQGAVKALETGAKIEIKIDPQQPYLIRDIQEKSATVTPAAGQTYVSRYSPADRGEELNDASRRIDALTLRYYDWAEPTWRIYTPFTVSIYKDGVLVGQQTLNVEGANQVQSVSTSEGAVKIENLGILGGQYLSPNTPSQIAIFKGYPNIYDLTQITSIIQYNQGASYSTYPTDSRLGTVSGVSNTYYSYWFGTNWIWLGTKHPAGITSYGTNPNTMVSSTGYGGWVSADDSGYLRRTPVKPVIGSSDKSSLPSDKRGYYSLTEFIESKGIANLALSTFDTKASGNTGALWQKASFVTDINGQTAFKLDIPWSAFGTPLVSIRVPTELADTWVEQPIVTQTEVSAVWQSTGTDKCDLYGSNRLVVTVTNKGTVMGSSHLTIQSSNSKLAVTPLEMTVNNLVPNVPQTVYFDATNLGVEDQVSEIPITIIAHDTYTGSETGRATVYGTLKPTLTEGETIFNLHVVEKGTSTPIVGLQVSIQYGSEGPSPFTDGNGDIALTLATTQGGAYTGAVYVESADTTVYKSASATYTLNNPTVYYYTLEVERKDQDYPTPFPWLIILLVVAIVVVVIFLAVLIYYARKQRRRR